MHVESFSLTSRFLIIPKRTGRTDDKDDVASEHKYVVMLYLFLEGEVFLLNHQVAPTVLFSYLAFYALPLSQTYLLELLK